MWSQNKMKYDYHGIGTKDDSKDPRITKHNYILSGEILFIIATNLIFVF